VGRDVPSDQKLITLLHTNTVPVVGSPVADVEKIGFSEKSRKSGDRKCPGDWEKSFIELPDAKRFLRNRSE
jgi:hypothetical protein